MREYVLPMCRGFILAILTSGLLLTAVSVGCGLGGEPAFSADVPSQPIEDAGCPEEAMVCADAELSEYGSAKYVFSLTKFQREFCGPDLWGPSSGEDVPLESTIYGCGNYTGTATFTLEDGSTLTLDEVGTLTGPKSWAIGLPGRLTWSSTPLNGGGTWKVRDATGQFAGMTGSGDDAFDRVRAVFTAKYRGTLDD